MTKDCFVPRNDAVALAENSRHGEERSHLKSTIIDIPFEQMTNPAVMVSQRTIFVFLCVIVGDLAVYYDTIVVQRAVLVII